jgi:hypothetical protein
MVYSTAEISILMSHHAAMLRRGGVLWPHSFPHGGA